MGPKIIVLLTFRCPEKSVKEPAAERIEPVPQISRTTLSASLFAPDKDRLEGHVEEPRRRTILAAAVDESYDGFDEFVRQRRRRLDSMHQFHEV
jgi:hypothetical protein